MVDLLACVRDGAEAAAALAAGFDGVIGPAPDAAALRPAALLGRLDATSGDAMLLLDRDDGQRRYRVITGHCPSEDDLDLLAGRLDGILVIDHGRIVDALSLPVLARLIDSAHARGLDVGIAGGLEPPDGPRLLALGPDLLVFGRALRDGDMLDSDRCRAVVALGARAPSEATPLHHAPAAPRDRIFVRDLVLPVAIGVYASEHGRRQRVGFSVEAELDPVGDGMSGIGAIVSYDLISDAIVRLTAERHIDFVEDLAEAIAAALLVVSRIAVVRVRVEKLDLGPGAVGIAIERVRPGPA